MILLTHIILQGYFQAQFQSTTIFQMKNGLFTFLGEGQEAKIFCGTHF